MSNIRQGCAAISMATMVKMNVPTSRAESLAHTSKCGAKMRDNFIMMSRLMSALKSSYLH
jgi:hypothetical protein